MARVKEFDTDKAIDQAMEIFWRNGFNKSSLSQLTEATGLHKGSLYGAFQSKEHLFQLCLDRYMSDTRNAFSNSSLGPKEYIGDFFSRKLNCSQKRREKGCLLMNSSMEFAHNAEEKKKLDTLLKGVQDNFKTALSKGKEVGEFSKSMNVNQTSERLLALAFTMENMGKLGKDKKFLANIANGTLSELKIQI
ncbi:MAG: hypothetical protein CL677_06585 [Bdellovibrionaceae bacterium]|nr:hypothetical protein [Pseudobdellovibrionaceae bacterium]|tara:strand:+ start:533 stop:1108 length:576 start_codon:yes stop_codon:yes gene_type:complete